MSNFHRQLWKQKPQAWGAVEAVQAALRDRLERLGICASNLHLALPFWGPGKLKDYSKNNIVFPSDTTLFETNGKKFSNNKIVSANNPIPSVSEITLIVTVSVNAYTLHGKIISKVVNADGIWSSPYAAFAIDLGTSSGAIGYNIGGTFGLTEESVASLYTFNKAFTAGLTFNGYYLRGYFNSKNVLSVVKTGTLTNSQYPYIIGADGRTTPTEYFNGSIYQILVFDHALSADIVFALSDNPYQLWQPKTRTIYSFPNSPAPIFLNATSILTDTPSIESTGVNQKHALTAVSITFSAFILGSPFCSTNFLSASDIATSFPILNAPELNQVNQLTGSNIITDVPEIGYPWINIALLTATNISTNIPLIEFPELKQKHVLASSNISTFEPLLTSSILSQINALTAINISTEFPVLNTPTSGFVYSLTSVDIITGAIISTEVYIDLNEASIAFYLPETRCGFHCGGELSFGIPQTACDISATSEILIQLIGTAGRTSLSFAANTEMLASLSFNLPISTMSSYTGAVIDMQYALSTMVLTAQIEAIVSIGFASPKTQIRFAAISQAQAGADFTLPISQMSSIGNVQIPISLSAQAGASACMMTAINNALANLGLATPTAFAVFTGYSDNQGHVSFSIPNTTWSSLVSTHTDGVLRHIRGAIR